jgi:hypothetical protein
MCNLEGNPDYREIPSFHLGMAPEWNSFQNHDGFAYDDGCFNLRGKLGCSKDETLNKSQTAFCARLEVFAMRVTPVSTRFALLTTYSFVAMFVGWSEILHTIKCEVT